MPNQKKVGVVTKKVIDTLGLTIPENSKIFCGPNNINHMKVKHPDDFKKYGDKIEEIISSPTYIAKHPINSSIEYIKVFVDDNNNHVLVAVRASGNGTLFARTLFVMSDEKIQKYREKNAFNSY